MRTSPTKPIPAFGLAMLVLTLSLAIIYACSDDSNPTGNGDTPAPLERLTTSGGNPSISPDGSHLLYRDAGQVIIQNLADSTEDTVFSGASDPAYSYHDDTIVINFGGLMALAISSGDTVRITAPSSNIETPNWSPTGSELVTHGTSPDGAYLVSYPSGTISMVPCSDGVSDCAGEGPSFSGDGQMICFEDGLEVMKVPRTGGPAVEVVGGLNDVTEPSWSPNGKYIAFVMQDSSSNALHIWVADARGISFGLWRVTDGGFFDRDPCWHIDSRTIYFSRDAVDDTLNLTPTAVYRKGFTPN